MNNTRKAQKTIGIFMSFLSENRGGPDVTAMWLIQALCDRYDVTLVTTSQFDLDFFNRFAGTQLEQHQFHIRRLQLLPTPSSIPMSALQGALFQRSARGYASGFDLCINAMNLLDLGVPAVHFLADIDWLGSGGAASSPTSAEATPRNGTLLRRLYHALSERAQAKSGRDLLHEDVLVSNSEWVASSLRTTGIESSVIYPPVPFPPRERDWETRRKDFVWIGRIDPSKRLEQAISIVNGLRNAGIDCAIHIVGPAVDKNYLASIRTLAKRMGNWVVLEGALYGEDKALFLSEFRYAIHTRADEPFGITLVELMKAGCIPFAPNSCGSGEIVSHPALLFSDEGQAVAKISKLLSDDHLCKSVRTFLQDRSELFSIETFRESVVTLVSSLFERPATTSDIYSSQDRAGYGHLGDYGT
jgi:glycosyltransferase involved in cell wall biosynthesis